MSLLLLLLFLAVKINHQLVFKSCKKIKNEKINNDLNMSLECLYMGCVEDEDSPVGLCFRPVGLRFRPLVNSLENCSF